MTVCTEITSRRQLRGDVFGSLRAAVGQPAFDSWFAAVRIEGVDGRVCYASVPTRFLRAWIIERYLLVLLEVLQRYDMGITEVQISVRKPVPKVVIQPEPDRARTPDNPKELIVAEEISAEQPNGHCRDDPLAGDDCWVGKITVAEIQRVVGNHYGVSRADILSSRRTGPLVRPRHVAIYLSKMLTLHSLPAIGRLFAGRDHTSVLHAIRKIESLLPNDPMLRDAVQVLSEKLTHAAAARHNRAEGATSSHDGEDLPADACLHG